MPSLGSLVNALELTAHASKYIFSTRTKLVDNYGLEKEKRKGISCTSQEFPIKLQVLPLLGSFDLQNVLRCPYLHFALQCAYDHVSLSDTTDITVYHKPLTSYSLPSKFSFSFSSATSSHSMLRHPTRASLPVNILQVHSSHVHQSTFQCLHRSLLFSETTMRLTSCILYALEPEFYPIALSNTCYSNRKLLRSWFRNTSFTAYISRRDITPALGTI